MSQVFGKYERIRRIAQGGMGEVFLARQTGVLDRLAILKSLRQDLAQEREFVDQFLDEARVAATLNHPNIVSIYDVGEWNGTYYIAMEYVPGEDLSKLWYAAAKAGVGLPFQVSVRVCYEAALGLDHAHKARDVRGSPLNIVHRDVSPQNIMVRGDGVVKLVDFGIAKAANKSSRTQTGMVKGKLQYMSPEQVRGEALDGRSDQFSLGVVLWEMCTGRRLFKADTEINTLQKILQSPIPKPSDHVPGFPPELETTILKMLQRDPEKRFRHLGDAANELKVYLDRAALTTGETSVASFVQQILGKELEERIADLTPMEPTEAAAPNPFAEKRAPTGQKPAVNDAPTQIVAGGDDDIGRMSTGPKGEWAVRKQDGSLMHFTEMSTLHQWILDGQVVGDDSFSSDGRNWKKLASAAQFQKFLEIAEAAKQVSQPPAQGPKSVPPVSGKTVTRPVPSTNDNPDTLQLGLDVGADAGAATGQFSLGDLPAAQTGTWGAPEIAMAVARAKGEMQKESLTPTTRVSEAAPARTGPRVPTFVWMLGGIVVALAVVVGGLAAFDPDLLRALVSSRPAGTEVLKALTAAKSDDLEAIEAVLKAAEPAAKAEGATADAVAAAAILHVAHARIDDETAHIAEMLADLKAPPPKKSAAQLAAEADDHRDAAYRLAEKALALDKASPGARLAMASFHAEKNAIPELDTDAASASAAAKGTPLEAATAAELAVLHALVDARAVLAQADVAALRAAAAKLSAVDDARARSLLPLLHARAALLDATDARKADLQKLHEEVRALGDSADARGALYVALDKAAQKAAVPAAPVADADKGEAGKGKAKPPEPPKPAPPAAPGTTPATTTKAATTTEPADGNASTNASTSTSANTNASVDAGVVAPPPPPETYESAMQKAKRAEQRGNPKEAERMAKKALELKPGSVEAQIILGFAYVDRSAFGNALQTFRAILAKDPKSCDAQIGVATALEQQGKTEDARKAYLGYVDICPNGKDAEMAKSAAARLE